MVYLNGPLNSSQKDIWLVVWNIKFIFPYIGNNHPNWLIFFRGVAQPPTRHHRNIHQKSAVPWSMWKLLGTSPWTTDLAWKITPIWLVGQDHPMNLMGIGILHGDILVGLYRMGPPLDSVNRCLISVANKTVDISRTSYWELFHGL